MGMVNYSSSLPESDGRIRSQRLGKLCKCSWSLTQWVRCLGGSHISPFFLAEGKRTKNSMLGFVSRGLRNTLSWGLTPIPGWLDIVVFTSILSSMLWVQKKVPVGDLRLQGQILPFQLLTGQKGESGQGDVRLGP